MQVKWRQWIINPHCLHPDVKTAPTESTASHDDFLLDIDMQGIATGLVTTRQTKFQRCDTYFIDVLRLEVF